MLAGGDQKGIVSFDDHEIADTHERNELLRTIYIIATRIDSHAVRGLDYIRVRTGVQVLLELVLVERRPGSEVVPAEVGGQAVEMGATFAFRRSRFEDRVVHADVFALRIYLAKDAVEIRGAIGRGYLLEQRSHLRQVLAHGVGQGAGAPDEDAAVPVIIAGGDELL